MSSCDIIIPVWNQFENTRDCIESIERNTVYPYRLIIIDNASAHKTARFLEDLERSQPEKVILVRNEVNSGFIKAVNQGIKLSTSEYMCVLNNDTVVTHGWLGELVKVLDKDPTIGIVNPSSDTLGQKLPSGITPDELAQGIESQRIASVELGNALGFCMLTRRRLYDEIGLLDEVFGRGNFDDTDFSMRAKARGYKVVRAIGSYVQHKEGMSFEKIKSFKRDFEINKRLFEERWGKSKRIAYVKRHLKGQSLDIFKKMVEDDIKKGSWIYIFSSSKKAKVFFATHSNVTFYHLRMFFYMSTFFRILFKKKRPDIIYSDNRAFLRLFRCFAPRMETGAFSVSCAAELTTRKTKITAAIITKNEESNIKNCIDCIKDWADEILVVDGYSTDRTVSIAEEMGARVIKHHFEDDFSKERNIAIEKASGGWVLHLDADDRVTPEFKKMVDNVIDGDDSIDVYKFRRKNFFLGHFMYHGGWYHYIPNLVRRDRVRFVGVLHERPVHGGNIGVIEADIEHHPFESLSQFITRHNRYSSIKAENIYKNERFSKLVQVKRNALGKTFKIFWKMYIKKKGYKEGLHGLVFSIFFAFTNFLVWVKYWELCCKHNIKPDGDRCFSEEISTQKHLSPSNNASEQGKGM